MELIEPDNATYVGENSGDNGRQRNIAEVGLWYACAIVGWQRGDTEVGSGVEGGGRQIWWSPQRKEEKAERGLG